MKYPHLLLAIVWLATAPAATAQTAAAKKESATANTGKKQAIEILQLRCNTCHRSSNPSKVFTVENMESNAKAIYRQVFVYRRMPKDNPASLAPAERDALQRWLEQQPGMPRMKK